MEKKISNSYLFLFLLSDITVRQHFELEKNNTLLYISTYNTCIILNTIIYLSKIKSREWERTNTPLRTL